jgi:Na+/proline symporter
MVAGVYTDVVQGLLMMGAAVWTFARAIGAAGGWRATLAAVADSAEFGGGFLEPLGQVPPLTAFGFFFVFGVGVLGQPQMLHKFYMIKDPARLRWFPAVLSGSQAVCVLLWLGVGLAVPALVARGELAALDRPDDAAIVFLLGFAPDLLAGLAIAAVLAAIMSTADSFLNIGSAVLVRDLPKVLGATPPRPLWGARLAVLAIAAAAALFSWLFGDLIALLGTFAFGTFAAALAPALAVGFNWARVTARAAGASIATGLVVNLGLELWSRQPFWPEIPGPPLPPGTLPAAVSLAASFTVLFAVTAVGRRPGAPPTAGSADLW